MFTYTQKCMYKNDYYNSLLKKQKSKDNLRSINREFLHKLCYMYIKEYDAVIKE